MFLKRLEVSGFKSFSDKLSIDFTNGVTAVVGPNGSGKSNISDAIRWVLGEQSAKSLRGAKMEDIIFAGSDARKAVNVAEVTLVLNNEDGYLPIDYSEVSVTRRLYRSGDSEYLLNRQSCRLKDIIDLFLDSGIGKEAFSIIGQGKVEEVLSSKPEDRRLIFDDAAGVLKYKQRKQKAEKKLAETTDNLNRVEDILHELASQVEPLKIQASIANDYLEKKAELTDIDAALLVHEINELHGEWEKEKVIVESLTNDKQLAIDELKTIEQQEARLQLELQQGETELEHVHERLLNTTKELEKSEGQRAVLHERKKNYTENKDKLIEQIEESKQRKVQYEERLQLEKEKLVEAERAVAKWKAELEEKQNLLLLSEKDLEEELERLKADYIEVMNEQSANRNEQRFLKDELAQKIRKNSELGSGNEQLLSEREHFVNRKKELDEKLAHVKKQIEEQLNQYNTRNKQIADLQANYEKKQSQYFEALHHLQQVKSKKSVLEEMQADFSGFFQGVKEVLKARETRLSGIVGAVAELLVVPKQYETAIEIALGGSAQHIVVGTEQAGREAISYLKTNRYGRATFLPLPVVQGRSFPSDKKNLIEAEDAFLGIASELVSYERQYESVMSNLLGQVVIAKDLAGANQLAAKLSYRFRIVTLDGDLINPGGAMTGGSLKQKTSSIIGRTQELEALTAKLATMEEKTWQLEQMTKEIKEVIQTESKKLEAIRDHGESLRETEQQLTSELRELELKGQSVNERLGHFDREKLAFEREEAEIRQRLEQLERDLQEAQTASELLEQQVNVLEEKRKQQAVSKEELRELLTVIKVKLAKEEERTAFVSRSVAEVQELFEKEAQDLQEQEEQFALLEGSMNHEVDGEKLLSDRIEASRVEKEHLIEQLDRLRKKQTTIREQYEQVSSLKRTVEANVKSLTEQLTKFEVSVNRLDVALDNRLNRLQADYELTFEAAKARYQLKVSPEEATVKVKLLKRSIEELGTVNLGAIEEYERVSERHEFLMEQKGDLVEAKDNLKRIIAEMDEEMIKRFSETFTAIREQFRLVYRELFGGGETDLILTNPDDLLTTGVDIVARPPGKKLQHLALLSGGERALTAIALLFAILQIRPIPFCVLDEVEAALDEANVSRFASYVKAFSKKTQFIVITHRKGTMEEADALYGVTMEESGVSKLVSVRLEETKELLEA